jgi:hypothetical protein
MSIIIKSSHKRQDKASQQYIYSHNSKLQSNLNKFFIVYVFVLLLLLLLLLLVI